MDRPEKEEKTLSEKLFEDRILFLGEISPESSKLLSMQLLYLESLNPKKDIFLYIDSPGGSVRSGLAIYDTVQFVQSEVWTICLGVAASMGAFLLAGGSAGKRVILPNSSVMIHQPLQQFGTGRFQATEVQIAAKEIMRLRHRLNELLAKNTGQSIEQIDLDTERDFWMNAEEALNYGIVNVIAKNREDISRLVKQIKEERSDE